MYKKILSLVLSLSIMFSAVIPTFANENNNYDNNKYMLEISEEMLSLDKQIELNSLINEFNMSEEDTKELVKIYFDNKNIYETRGKVGVIVKVIKVAKPIITKAMKMFGLKMGEKTFADFTDYLFDWQDDLQNGIESFLINEWGWNSTASYWTAKTIMFVAF